MTKARFGPWLVFLLLLTPAARADSRPPPERDGAPTSPLFVADEKTPCALMIVPVPTGPPGPHAHGGAK